MPSALTERPPVSAAQCPPRKRRVLKPEFAGFRTRRAQPGDLALVVEIADTSRAFDLSIKAAVYARTGITEYWILDVAGRRLIVLRRPEGGQYTAVTSYSQDESVAPAAATESSLATGTLFPE